MTASGATCIDSALTTSADGIPVCDGLGEDANNTLIDGEVIAFDDDGRPSFNALRSRLTSARSSNFLAFVRTRRPARQSL